MLHVTRARPSKRSASKGIKSSLEQENGFIFVIVSDPLRTLLLFNEPFFTHTGEEESRVSSLGATPTHSIQNRRIQVHASCSVVHCSLPTSS